MKKLEYLEGLRGTAAFVVVIAHYLQFYFVGPFFKNPDSSIEYMLSKTPLNLFYNGNFAVCIFFVLSGYVLSIKFLQTNENEILVASSVKRYFRLLIPVFVSILFAYILLVFNAYGSFTYYTYDTRYEEMSTNFFVMLKTAFFDIFFAYDNSYNAVLWTMTYELFGSLLIFSFLSLFGQVKKRVIVYLVLIAILFNSYFLAFILGLMLCDWDTNRVKNPKKPIIFILFIVGIFLGSYPYPNTENTIYNFLNVEFLNVKYMVFYHIIGASLLLLVLLNSEIMKSFFSLRIFSFLGKISFSLYLVHFPILASLSFFLFDKLIDKFSYKISFVITFIISVTFTILVAYFMYKLVDKKAIYLSKWIYKKYFQKVK